MKKQKQILPLDKDVEDEVSKLAGEEVQKPVEKLEVDTNIPEVHTVELDTIIKFEAKAKTETKENEENGTERGDTSRENGAGRETSISRRTSKGKSGLIY